MVQLTSKQLITFDILQMHYISAVLNFKHQGLSQQLYFVQNLNLNKM